MQKIFLVLEVLILGIILFTEWDKIVDRCKRISSIWRRCRPDEGE